MTQRTLMTPGEVAYAAYMQAVCRAGKSAIRFQQDIVLPDLPDAWEAAAQAVRAQWQEEVLLRVMTPEERATWHARKHTVRTQEEGDDA